MSANGAFIGSQLGAFFESQNNERAGGGVGETADLFAAWEATWNWDSNDYAGPFPDPQAPLLVNRGVIEIQGWNADTGASLGIIYSNTGEDYWAKTTVNPPNKYDTEINTRIWSLERVGDHLYLLNDEPEPQVDREPVQYTNRVLRKLSLDGTVVATRTWEGRTRISTDLWPEQFTSGSQQDGDEEPKEIKLYAFGRSTAMASGDASELMVVEPSDLSDATPVAGLGTTYDSNPHAAFGTKDRVVAFHLDATLGGGVRYYYNSYLDSFVRAVQGTSGFAEWTGPANRSNVRISASFSSPLIHMVSNSSGTVFAYSPYTGAFQYSNAGTGGGGEDNWSVRQLTTSTSASFLCSHITKTAAPGPTIRRYDMGTLVFETDPFEHGSVDYTGWSEIQMPSEV